MLAIFIHDYDDFAPVLKKIESENESTPRNRSEMNASDAIDPCAFSTLDQPYVRVLFIIAYLIVFVCICGGNFLLLIVVGVHPAMRTVTNFFLANLATADLLIALFCVVQNLMHLFVFEQALWPLGEFLCESYVFFMHLIPCTSAGLLLVLSCERYVAIMHPILARTMLTKNRLAITTAVVWAISVITNVPYYLAADYREYTEMINVSPSNESDQYRLELKPGAETLAWCGRAQRGVDQKIMFTFSFVFWYVIPFSAMLVIYSVIGVALWRSTGVDALTMMSSNVGSSNNEGGSCMKWRRPKRKAASNASKNEPSIELISLSRSDQENHIDRKTSEEDAPRSRSIVGANQKYSAASKHSQHHSVHSVAEGRDAMEGRKRVIRLLISIILAFAILTLPNHLRLLANAWSPPERRCNHGFQALVQPLSFLLLFCNSGINPILYAFMSKKFRRAVHEIFSRKALREQRRERFLTSIRSTAVSEAYTLNTEFN